MSANEITNDQSRGKTRIDACVDWLKLMLAGGKVKSVPLEKRAKAAGFSTSTYKRARSLANVQAEKDSFDGGWVSYLDGQ